MKDYYLYIYVYICIYFGRGAKFEFSGCGVPAFPRWFFTTFHECMEEDTT